MSQAVQALDLVCAAGQTRIEYQWVGPQQAHLPVMVFLHEGLGSVSMWRDFPAQLCEAAPCRGLVYSRPGYGQSQALVPHDSWGPDFMHTQALQVLPALLDALQLHQPVLLFGHSDGASIALLLAAHAPQRVCALVAVAPHVFVEDKTVAGIARLQTEPLRTQLLASLARHHAHPTQLLDQWTGAWLAPAFRAWSITETIANVRCPLLAVQGSDDEYGTMAQVDDLVQRTEATEWMEIDNCGHWPHRDHAPQLLARACAFLQRLQGDMTCN